MPSAGSSTSDPAVLADRIGYGSPHELLAQALVHRSYSYENGGLPTNERLEFLGDAVLGLVVTQEIYERFPAHSEGDLARLRSAIVSAAALAEVAREIGLGEHLRLGKGEVSSGGRDKSSILADGLEAIIGACYLEHGERAAAVLVHRLIDPAIDRAVESGAGRDWKTALQELVAAHGLGAVEYRIEATGPDHAPEFTATVVVAGRPLGTGVGRSKKAAEQLAARHSHPLLDPVSGQIAPHESAVSAPAPAPGD